jgi:hypothetical protein
MSLNDAMWRAFIVCNDSRSREQVATYPYMSCLSNNGSYLDRNVTHGGFVDSAKIDGTIVCDCAHILRPVEIPNDGRGIIRAADHNGPDTRRGDTPDCIPMTAHDIEQSDRSRVLM